MNSTAQQYDAAKQALDTVLDAVPADRWSDPSPCEGWAARDVIRHLIETQREFLTGRGLDVGTAPDLDADPPAGWRSHTERALEVLRDDGVVSTGYDGAYGNKVVVEHEDGTLTWYAHMSEILRTSGVVKAGDPIGRVGSTGNSTGNHLHLEVRPSPEIPVPPLTWLRDHGVAV